jgi:hypothetical protein
MITTPVAPGGSSTKDMPPILGKYTVRSLAELGCTVKFYSDAI